MDYTPKHTPGPWTLTTVRTSGGICHKVGPFPWRQGEHNHACVYVDGRMAAWQDELLANARLIKAAPLMLEALELAETYLPEGDRYAEDRSIIRSAIATAKGEKE